MQAIMRLCQARHASQQLLCLCISFQTHRCPQHSTNSSGVATSLLDCQNYVRFSTIHDGCAQAQESLIRLQTKLSLQSTVLLACMLWITRVRSSLLKLLRLVTLQPLLQLLQVITPVGKDWQQNKQLACLHVRAHAEPSATNLSRHHPDHIIYTTGSRLPSGGPNK